MFSGPNGRFRAAVRLILLPAFLYLIVFTALTFPLMLRFSTHLFADLGDGVQNYWNLWWMNKAIVELRAPFWSTPYLHYPYGTSLLGHTLNPFNGFLVIPLLPFLTLLQAYNFVVVFSFVAGGVTAFLLALYVTRSYVPSLIGGGIFTFSNYHFAHAEGHMQLVSLEWIPLFALLWLMLLERPRPLLGLAAGLALFAVALCDYYYLMYSVLFGGLALLWRALRLREPLFVLAGPYRAATAAFLATTLATSGVLVGSMLLLNARDPLIGAHPVGEFSLDLLAPFIPGGHWRFAELTAGYWSSLPGFIHESSVHLGLSVVALLAYVWVNRARVPAFQPGLWYLVLGFFAVLSLGPALQAWGRQVSPPVLPYAWLEAVFPPLALSGVPVRMMVMVTLAASVIAAMGLKMLFAAGPAKRWVAVALLALLVVEYLPSPVPASQLAAPEYVRVLAALEDDGKGVLDMVSGQTLTLYYQTVHEKPMALGYIARLPRSVTIIDAQLLGAWERGDYEELKHVFGIRYLVTDPSVSVRLGSGPATLLHEDAWALVYDLGVQD
jgi:hypothetical protein